MGTGRQNVLNAFATSGGFYELAGTLYREAFWLVSDQLGTPRMIVGKSGSLASVKRHDYLPFGEELYAGMSGRTTTQGYTGDSTRQHFTGYEADSETGLNFAEARYQSNLQGRFTSVDPLGASACVGDPQSFNRYSYANNNPTNLTDPSGMMAYGAEHSYSDVAEGFWGRSVDLNRSHFGGPAILYAAGLLQNIAVEGGIQERNHAASSSGSYKPNWLRRGLNAAIDRRTGFSFAASKEPAIVFDSVDLLDDALAGFPQGPLSVLRPVNPIRSAKIDEFNSNLFTLDVDDPKVDTSGILAIRVKFHVINGGAEEPTVNVTTTDSENRRWRIAGTPIRTEGGLIFTVNVYDAEARINSIYVDVRTKWTASIWDNGKLNDFRYKSSKAEIKLQIGPRDRY